MNPLQVAEERLLHILAKSYGKDLDKEGCFLLSMPQERFPVPF